MDFFLVIVILVWTVAGAMVGFNVEWKGIDHIYTEFDLNNNIGYVLNSEFYIKLLKITITSIGLGVVGWIMYCLFCIGLIIGIMKALWMNTFKGSLVGCLNNFVK